MKKVLILVGLTLLLSACSPVLSRELMREGSRDVPLRQVVDSPEGYKGKLFILGGLIVGSRLTETGSQIEALAIPVDAYGYLREGEHGEGRFLAVYPKAKGMLDPAVYRKGREITLAGAFLEIRKGKIDDMEYIYPVFEVRQIYLWSEERYYPYAPYYYPYPYYDPYFYDRWGRPYPNPYWPLW